MAAPQIIPTPRDRFRTIVRLAQTDDTEAISRYLARLLAERPYDYLDVVRYAAHYLSRE